MDLRAAVDDVSLERPMVVDEDRGEAGRRQHREVLAHRIECGVRGGICPIGTQRALQGDVAADRRSRSITGEMAGELDRPDRADLERRSR